MDASSLSPLNTSLKTQWAEVMNSGAAEAALAFFEQHQHEFSDKSLLEYSDKAGNTALAYAMRHHRLDLADTMIALGADINHARRHSGAADQLVGQAASAGNLSHLQWLLEHGADASALNGQSHPMPTLINHHELVNLLLKRGAPEHAVECTIPPQAPLINPIEPPEYDPIVPKDETIENVRVWAAKHGHYDIIELLLERDRTVEKNRKEDAHLQPQSRLPSMYNHVMPPYIAEKERVIKANIEALHAAIKSDHVPMVQSILSSDPVYARTLGSPDYHIMRDVHSLAMADALYAVRPDLVLSTMERTKRTPLHAANTKELVQWVHQKDPSIIELVPEGSDSTLLHWAQNAEVAQALYDLKPELINALDELRNTPMHRNQKPEMLAWLFHKKPDMLHAMAKDGRTPIVDALLNLNYKAFHTLGEYGADLNTLITTKGTLEEEQLIAHALRAGSYDIANYIVNKDVALNDAKQPLLHILIANGRMDIQQKLKLAQNMIDHGIDIHAKDRNHEDALLKAASKNNLNLVHLLLKHGAASSINDNQNSILQEAPLHRAIKHERVTIAALLLKHGADVKITSAGLLTPLHHAACNRDLDSIRLLLEHGADVNAVSENLSTPLHLVAKKTLIQPKINDLKCMRILIDHGADVNAANNYLNTPLHFAASNTDLAGMALLLDHGADIRAMDREGRTPLEVISDHVRIVDDSPELLQDKFRAMQCIITKDPQILEMVKPNGHTVYDNAPRLMQKWMDVMHENEGKSPKPEPQPFKEAREGEKVLGAEDTISFSRLKKGLPNLGNLGVSIATHSGQMEALPHAVNKPHGPNTGMIS